MSEALPIGWVSTTVAGVAEIVSGSGFPEERQGRTTGKFPFAKVRDISKAVLHNDSDLATADHFVGDDDVVALRARIIAPGSVVFAKIGEGLRLNRRAYTRRPLLIDNNCMALSPRGSVIEARYLFWFMTTVDLSPLAVATSVPSVRRGDIDAIALPLPPLAEQRRIVARIEALFARTRTARADLLRIAPLADRYHLALLRSALRGELTAEWRSGTGALEPAAQLVSRTPAPTQPRGGREATDEVIEGVAALSVNHPQAEPPPGWAWVPLLRLARQESGHTPSRGVAAYWNGDIPWVGIRDAGEHHGGVITDTAQHVTQAGLDNSSARLLPAQTVCLSRTASVGYIVVMGRSMATSQDFVTWTCSPALLPDFLKYALLAEGGDIRRFGKGSTHTTIYFPEIRALHICLPPLAEQRAIVRLLDQAIPATGAAGHDADRALVLLDHLERSILARASRGELVPQDPADEPSAVTLARADTPAPTPRRRGRAHQAA